jgi:hypothetical protein
MLVLMSDYAQWQERICRVVVVRRRRVVVVLVSAMVMGGYLASPRLVSVGLG